MSIKAALHHVTHYTYDRPIALGPQVVRLRPAPHARTAVPAYSLKVLPANHFINWQQDPNGNWLARLIFPDKTTELKIEVDLTADMSVINPFDFFVEEYAQARGFTYADDLTAELKPYLVLDEAMAPEVDAFLERLPARNRTPCCFLVALNAQVAQEITYGVPHGARCPDSRRDPDAEERLLPRLGLADGADPAPPRARRPLRLGLPDPARPRHHRRGRPGRNHHRLHRPARLGRGLPAGGRLDRSRRHLPACSAAKGTSRSPPRRTMPPPLRSPGWRNRPRSSSASRCR